MELKEKIIKQISDNKVILFMKGTKEMPMCGFSSTVVNILNMHNTINRYQQVHHLCMVKL